MSTEFSIHLRVRFAECDMYGHVFNAHYLTWFDMAHSDLLAQALRDAGSNRDPSSVHVVVAECGVRYLAPSYLDDELEVVVTIEPLTTTSMTSHYEVRRGETTICNAFVRHVCFDLGQGRKTPWPEDLRAGIEPYVVQAATA